MNPLSPCRMVLAWCALRLIEYDPVTRRRRLRRLFATLYPNPRAARIVLHDAGLVAERVDLSGPAWIFWDDILRLSELHPGATEKLLLLAYEDFPELLLGGV